MNRENFIITTFFPYISIGIWFWISFFYNDFSQYKNIFFLGLLLIVLKDLFLHFVELKPIKIKTIDKESLKKDWLSFWEETIIWNRKRFFPIILVVYIIQLLVKQTHLWWLHDEMIFRVFSDNFLLILVVISGIWTIFKEDLEKKYEVEEKSMDYSVFWIILTFCLSIIWAYIILNQTARLGNLSFVISFISGVLIFLVWVLVLEDEEEEIK